MAVKEKLVFGETDPEMIGEASAPESAFVMQASLVSSTGGAGSASGGTKASMKFEIHPEDLARLILEGAVGHMAFDVTFAQTGFGTGLTIGVWNGRRDEDGSSRAWISLTVPETQQEHLSAIWTRRLNGAKAALVLDPIQSELDDVLTAKAE